MVPVSGSKADKPSQARARRRPLWSSSGQTIAAQRVQRCAKRTSDAVGLLGLDPPYQHQNDNDDQNRADETNASMTVTVSVAAEAPAESAKQEDDKDNYKNKSQRHGFISICGT